MKDRCKAVNKFGKPCSAAPTGGGYCFFHGNPKKAQELGRKGGRKNRRTPSLDVPVVSRLANAKAIRDEIEKLVGEARCGKIDAKLLSSLVSTLKLQLEVIEVTDLEERLARLEKERAEGSHKPNKNEDGQYFQ